MISMVSESFPHLRRGILRDFKNILNEIWDKDRWSETNKEYNFGKGKIEFFSADDASKLRGGRRDILFVNEANNITKEAFDELDVRTRRFSIIDFNPVAEFWAHELQHEPFVEWIHSTYLDAVEVLEKSVIDNIISRKDRDPAWWTVYGLGLVGKLEGLVHPEFQQVDSLPEKFDREIFGLDFGYSMDPAALVQNRFVGDAVYSKELLYEKGLTNDQLAKRLDSLGVRRGHDIIIADSAEPKSIDEIKLYGFDIRPCIKGPDSVRVGIQRVNQFKLFWTKDSLFCIKEQRNYHWEKDKDGKFTNKPIDEWNHGMDARRMAVTTVPEPKVIEKFQTSSPVSTFRVDPDKLTEHSELVCGIWVEPNMSAHCLLALWNARDVRLWVWAEQVFKVGMPETVMPALVALARSTTDNKITRMSGGESRKDRWRIYGNEPMFGKNQNDLSVAYSRYGMYLEPNEAYEETGAIMMVSRLLQRGGLKIHQRCAALANQCGRWIIEDGEPGDGVGLARCLTNIVSACTESSRFDPAPKPMKRYSLESTKFQRTVDMLAKTGKLEDFTDDEIEQLVMEDPRIHDKNGWM